MRLRPPSATVLNAGGGISFLLGFAPLNKQSKLLKFQIHNPIRATFVPITHDKLKSMNWYSSLIWPDSSELLKTNHFASKASERDTNWCVSLRI